MLVLGRKKHQSVVIGDEITLTVEEICDTNNGKHIFGASVRLGFQTPREIPIYRSELRDERRRKRQSANAEKRQRPPLADRVDIANAQVRLRIQVPRKVPVCLNGKPTVGVDSEEAPHAETPKTRSVHRVTCGKDDRIAICNNIMISAIRFHRMAAREAIA